MAREKGLDLSAIAGTGPGGRIVKADVEGATAMPDARRLTPDASAPAGAPAAPAPAGRGDTELVELSRTQQLIARRMAESKATVPDFALDMDIDMEAAVAMRAQLKQVADVVPSFNDMVVKACALALREFPRANGSYKDGRYELHGRVNVGVAVAAQDALVVPTIFDADRKSLGEIARAARELAGKVREGTISPPELSGGTFTVSNLGMYGITSFTAVINPPQAAILAVGAIEQRPAVVDGALEARHRMAVTLACDHRILYGADAAQFLARVRDLLQAPASLAL
jgi:pyruvate dehydrogenase E2 component (dihydrolipoamide acetyltransferase)